MHLPTYLFAISLLLYVLIYIICVRHTLYFYGPMRENKNVVAFAAVMLFKSKRFSIHRLLALLSPRTARVVS